MGAVGGESGHISAYPRLRGIGRTLPPVDIIASIAGAGDQVEPPIPGEVNKHAADADAWECVIDQVRLPGAAACSAEPVELFWIARRDDEFGHPVVVQIANHARHALGRRALVDCVTTIDNTSITSFFCTRS